jgi:hypothetical protein
MPALRGDDQVAAVCGGQEGTSEARTRVYVFVATRGRNHRRKAPPDADGWVSAFACRLAAANRPLGSEIASD